MEINRNNCEAWFLDYYEGNLGDDQVRELFAFLVLNPDLREIFDSYEEVSFAPEKQVRFDAKDLLKKPVETKPGIDESNYEEFMVGSLEGTLSAEEAEQLEHFLAAHPAKRAELELLKRAILEPDTDIVFEAKDALKRSALVTEANFAEYAVAFTDGELSGEMLQQFEAFVAEHPQLRQELDLLQRTKLQPDTAIVFDAKASLYRKELVITETNFEEIAVASVEGELNAAEARVFAAYLAAHPEKQQVAARYAQTKLQPDTTIVFEDKASLRRRERGGFGWMRGGLRFAAAAAVILFAVIFWWNRGDVTNHTNPVKNIAETQKPNGKNNPTIIAPATDSANARKTNDRQLAAVEPSQSSSPVVQSVPERLTPISGRPVALHTLSNEPGVTFSDLYYQSFDDTSSAARSNKAISATQYLMRWAKTQLDRRPEPGEEDEREMVASVRSTNNENQDVSGFDLTSSAMDRISDATGANLHLVKGAEGTVLQVGKYDILLNRRR